MGQVEQNSGTRRTIVVVDYDPAWSETFASLADVIGATLGHLAIAIEHVGSTSVPGLAAKPIIDMNVLIASRSDLGPRGRSDVPRTANIHPPVPLAPRTGDRGRPSAGAD